MNIPKTIKIGINTYKIEWVENLDSDYKLGGQLCMGDLKIKLPLDKLPIYEQGTGLEQGLMHEIVHALDKQYNILATIPEEEKENFVETLSQLLLMVIKDNKLDFSK